MNAENSRDVNQFVFHVALKLITHTERSEVKPVKGEVTAKCEITAKGEVTAKHEVTAKSEVTTMGEVLPSRSVNI